MRQSVNPSFQLQPDAQPDARRAGRLRIEALRSSHGEVADLSATGMRIIGRRFPEGPFEIDVYGPEAAVRLRAEVVWTRRAGLRKHEAGLRFLNVTPAERQTLSRLAMNCSCGRVLGTPPGP